MLDVSNKNFLKMFYLIKKAKKIVDRKKEKEKRKETSKELK